MRLTPSLPDSVQYALLQNLLEAAGLPHQDCTEKSELVARVMGARTAMADEEMARRLQMEEDGDEGAVEDAMQRHSQAAAAEQADMEMAERLQAQEYGGGEYEDDDREDSPMLPTERFSPATFINQRLQHARRADDTHSSEDPDLAEQQARMHHAISQIQQQLDGRDELLHTILRPRSGAESRDAMQHEGMRVRIRGMQAPEPGRGRRVLIRGADPRLRDMHHMGDGGEDGEPPELERLVQLLLPMLQEQGAQYGEELSYEQLMELQERLGTVDRGADASTIDANTSTERMRIVEGQTASVCTVYPPLVPLYSPPLTHLRLSNVGFASKVPVDC